MVLLMRRMRMLMIMRWDKVQQEQWRQEMMRKSIPLLMVLQILANKRRHYGKLMHSILCFLQLFTFVRPTTTFLQFLYRCIALQIVVDLSEVVYVTFDIMPFCRTLQHCKDRQGFFRPASNTECIKRGTGI